MDFKTVTTQPMGTGKRASMEEPGSFLMAQNVVCGYAPSFWEGYRHLTSPGSGDAGKKGQTDFGGALWHKE